MDKFLGNGKQYLVDFQERGEFITDAAAEAGTYRKKGARWLAAARFGGRR